MKTKIYYLNSKSLFFLLLIIIVFAQSCHKDDPLIQEDPPIEEVDPCAESLDSYIIINDEKLIIDLDDPELMVRCQYDSTLNKFVVAIDELIETVGGIEINDVIGVGFEMDQLKPGDYNLVRTEDTYCETGEFSLMPNEAFSSIQTSNCCEFYNSESSIQVFECDNSIYIKADSIVYSEFECDIDLGGSFVASFQIKCI